VTDAGRAADTPPSPCRAGSAVAPEAPEPVTPRRSWNGVAPSPGKDQLAKAIFEYLELFHNRTRRHSSLGMLTPLEFEQAFTVA
jgi:transposase InsO family protein